MDYVLQLVIFIIKGMVVGIVASAPMGPVGILCIRRTLKKGRAYGLVTGAGAALSDLLYALLTGFGMSLVSTVTTDERVLFWMKICGSIMLCAFGIFMFRTGPKPKAHPESKTKGTLLRNFLTSFVITLCNPAIIFLFIALFNMLAPFAGAGDWVVTVVSYVSIVAGAMLWWIGLTYVINKMSSSFGEKGIQRLNRSIGILVIVISVVYALLTLCGMSVSLADGVDALNHNVRP